MRSLATLAVAFLLLLVQSTVLELSPVRAAAPGLGLLVCLHVGLSARWSVSAAAIVSLCTGYLLDLVSGAPQGAHALVFIVMAVGARALSSRFSVRGVVLSAATGFSASLLAALLIVVVRAQLDPEGGYGGLRQAPLEALLTGVCAPLVLGLLRKIDGKLDPARARVGLSRGPRTLGDGVGLR